MPVNQRSSADVAEATLLRFWAKSPRDNPDSTAYHPLACHLIDVAAVTGAIWTDILTPWARSSMARGLALPLEESGRLISFWAGTHDIGKCCPAFQLQLATAVERFRTAGFSFHPTELRAPHGMVSARVLAERLPERFGTPREVGRQVATAVGGHHGKFPLPGEPSDLPAEAVGRGQWVQFRDDLLDLLAGIVRPPRELQIQELSNPVLFWIAGLISVADWIGSNEDFFPYAVAEGQAAVSIHLATYAVGARAKATRALRELGWTKWHPEAGARDFKELFDFEPNALQKEIVDLARGLDRPGLVIVEAAMGEGKTEAAEYLSDHWTVTLGQGGSYFALPTQATSNQMFSRVSGFLRKRYPGDVVNLQLLHGHASLSAELETLRRNAYRVFAPSAIAEDEPGNTADLVAASWFANRKRGLLAPFGVGTVDQALMSVLQVKHVFVRLFGLAHKTVIVDEVHAYDTYMSTLLEQLLRWLAALGSSVVLLSATLPDARRRSLVQAFAEGAGEDEPRVPHAVYPRLTSYVAGSGARSATVETSERSQKRVAIEWLNQVDDLGNLDNVALGRYLREMLQDGGCAAVVCNTVRRAQDVFTALKPFFPGDADDGSPQLDLLHSRFLLKDRQTRERRVLERFGPPSGPREQPSEGRRPDRAVLVATQVIEQSLDIDFDLMVTDMAPVDLMLQRSGRLHRHLVRRPSRLECPILGIVQRPVGSGDAPVFEEGTRRVYAPHILLRSWLGLRGRDSIGVPDDVEELIECVYDSRSCAPSEPATISLAWDETLRKLVEKRREYEDEARLRYIKRPGFSGELGVMMSNPQEEDNPDLHVAFQALTRLSDQPSVEAVLLYGGGDGGGARMVPDGPVLDLQKEPTGREIRDLLMRSTSISGWWVAPALPVGPPRGWEESSLLRHYRLLLLDEDQKVTAGDYEIRLDHELGVVITRTGKGD
jgi:CRISPR-associated endonuclease/helicase Cas3